MTGGEEEGEGGAEEEGEGDEDVLVVGVETVGGEVGRVGVVEEGI